MVIVLAAGACDRSVVGDVYVTRADGGAIRQAGADLTLTPIRDTIVQGLRAYCEEHRPHVLRLRSQRDRERADRWLALNDSVGRLTWIGTLDVAYRLIGAATFHTKADADGHFIFAGVPRDSFYVVARSREFFFGRVDTKSGETRVTLNSPWGMTSISSPCFYSDLFSTTAVFLP